MTTIPTQNRITHQMLKHRLTPPTSHSTTHFSKTVDSVLCTEMSHLETREENASQSVLYYPSMTWLGLLGPHRRDEV